LIAYFGNADAGMSLQHAVDVVQSAGNSTFNYANPVRRDVVNAGAFGEQMVIRWVTDNSGPWFLHWYAILLVGPA